MILILIKLEDRHLDAIRSAAPGAQIIVLSDPREEAGKIGAFIPDVMEMLPQADWVVITVPLTHETKGMIGERELKALKRSTYIINISRGPIIQEQALIKALPEEWIAGAGAALRGGSE